ncbi:MAG: AmmeMemoRadiSam system protein B, partial [Terracidiphilus sp.]
MCWLRTSLVALLAVVPLQQASAASPQKVRQAGVAGGFYPADPKVLSAMIDDLLAHATPPPIQDPILAVVAPHAGYQFSGPVAAYTYAELKGRKFSRVVVIAPTHYVGFDFTSIYDGDAYATPLGTVQVDKAFARQLVKLSPTMQLSGMGHDITSAGAEHSIEVQLPWLQRVLGEFELVPIVMGDQSYESSRALGVALAKLIDSDNKDGSTLILASSDLSHYHT